MTTVDRGLTAFDSRLDEIVRQSFQADPPSTLYHYTTWTAARGILSTGRFWFTAHDCTNDEAELASADDIIVSTVGRLQRSMRRTPADLLAVFLANYPRRAKVTAITQIYLACFSEVKDLESQWQKYADEGRGLCLGVRVLKENAPENGGVGMSLLRVDYSEASWRRRVAQGFGAVCGEYSQVEPANEVQARRLSELALNALYRIAALAALTAKQEHWESEREWRQVALAHAGVSIKPCERRAAGRIVRYLDLRVREGTKLLALDEIILGRNQEPSAARSRLQSILAAAGYLAPGADLPRITIASTT